MCCFYTCKSVIICQSSRRKVREQVPFCPEPPFARLYSGRVPQTSWAVVRIRAHVCLVWTSLRLMLSPLFHSAYHHHPRGFEEGGICYTHKASQPNPMLQMAELSCLPGQSLPCGHCSGSCSCKKDMTLYWTWAESPVKIMQERFHVGAAVSWVLFYSLVLRLAIQG